MSRWSTALLVAAAVGVSIASDVARAGSLVDGLAAIFNPGSHSASARPPARVAVGPAERAAKRQARVRRPPDIKLSVPVPDGREPVREPQPKLAPAAILETSPPGVESTFVQSAPEAVSGSEKIDALRPHTVQTLSVSPSVVPPTLVEGKEAAASAVGGGREPPAAVAVAPVEEAIARPVIASTPDPAPASAMSLSIVEFCLLLFVIICLLLTIKWRSTTQLLTLMQLDRPLLVKIKHRPATDAWIGRTAAAAKSAGRAAPARPTRAAPAAAPPWKVTSEYGVRPGSQPPAQPPERSKPDDRLEPDRGGPELEDQLARIVRDQFLVPLRKAS